MAQRKTEHTAEIAVIANDGTHHTVDEYTSFTLHDPINGPSQWIPGSHSYALGDDHCNVVDDTTFEVVRTDQILRRV